MIYTPINTSEKLKYCPFCGGNAELRYSDEFGCLVQCKNCDMGTHNGFNNKYSGYEKRAIDFWNTRYTSEEE